MIKLDLVTGFLGAGKTTFLKKYAGFLLDKGERICIIENDFGAINVDMVILKELESENCNLEMIVGGDGYEAHKRRLKTKLIAMAMNGFDRVIIEPSGVFDPDEFFDLVYEEPLDRWYEIGNVICIADPTIDRNLSDASGYILATEAGVSGAVVFSKVQECTKRELDDSIEYIQNTMEKFGCLKNGRKIRTFSFDWESTDTQEFNEIVKCGYNKISYPKLPISDTDGFNTIFYFDFKMDNADLEKNIKEIFSTEKCGKVHRIKGITLNSDGSYYEINATKNEISFKKINAERAVVIVIGEELNKAQLTAFLGEPTL